MQDLIANRYRVLAQLGEGGMGTVYRVADRFDGDRELALKTIRSEQVITASARLRFKEEFRAMSRLKHPNTIEVFDFGEIDAHNQYLTMEVVPGRELTEVMDGRAMPLAEAYTLLIQLLQALGFIHSRHYVHRDIKAQNIRVTPEGTLKLMDFGLMSQIGLPSTRQVTGTPGYLAPEVARGGLIDASTDLYSVGCLAYEMITGRLPFEGKLIDVVRAHLGTPATPLRQLRADAPEGLERIVMRLLEKEQTRRYRVASEVIDDLAALAGVKVARENLDQRMSYLTTSVMVGRDRELAELETAMNGALAGRGGAVFIGAPAGVGKSRLVNEAVLHAKLNGMLVLHGECHEAGMAPYEALATALRPALAHGTPEEGERYAAACAKIFPEMCDDGDERLEDPQALREAALSWLSALSERMPLLFLLDDLHWADPQTVEIFNHVIRNSGEHRILCLGTFRNDETPPGSPLWYTLDEQASLYLKLGPLERQHQLTLLKAMLGELRISDHFDKALYDATAGNPFFLTEVVRALLEDGDLARRDGMWHFPPDTTVLTRLSSMEATIMRRMSYLCANGCTLASVAAVLGRHQDLEMLLAVSRLAEDELFARLDELVERQFILKEDDRYTFPHDRMREILYAQLDDETRRELHQRAGAYLEATDAAEVGALTHELAYHFGRGNDAAKAFHYLLKAGNQADAAGAEGLAVDLWTQAESFLERLDWPDKQQRLRKLWLGIGVNTFATRPDVAVRYLGKLATALEQAEPGTPDGDLRGEVNGLRAIALGYAGRIQEAMVAGQLAYELSRDRDETYQAASRFTLASSLVAASRYDEVIALCKEVYQALAGVDLLKYPFAVRGAMVGATSLANVCAMQGIRPDESLRDESIHYATLNNDDNPFTVHLHFGLWWAWTGRYEEAQGYIESTTQKCRKMGVPPYPWVLYLRPYLLWQQGDYEQASALLEQALLYPHLHQMPSALHHVSALRSQLALELGQLDSAHEGFAALEAEGREREMFGSIQMALQGRARVAIARKEFAQARKFLEEAHALASRGVARNPLQQCRVARLRGELELATHDAVAAGPHLDEALAIARRPEQDNRFEQAKILRAMGDRYQALRDRTAADQAFREAGELFQRMKNLHGLHGITQRLEELHNVKPAQSQEGLTPMARWNMVSSLRV